MSHHQPFITSALLKSPLKKHTSSSNNQLHPSFKSKVRNVENMSRSRIMLLSPIKKSHSTPIHHPSNHLHQSIQPQSNTHYQSHLEQQPLHQPLQQRPQQRPQQLSQQQEKPSLEQHYQHQQQQQQQQQPLQQQSLQQKHPFTSPSGDRRVKRQVLSDQTRTPDKCRQQANKPPRTAKSMRLVNEKMDTMQISPTKVVLFSLAMASPVKVFKQKEKMKVKKASFLSPTFSGTYNLRERGKI